MWLRWELESQRFIAWGIFRMIPESDDLEQELLRNLKLRRELGGEVRLELLIANAKAGAKGGTVYRRMEPNPEATIPNLIRMGWVSLGFAGVALAAFIAVWLS